MIVKNTECSCLIVTIGEITLKKLNKPQTHKLFGKARSMVVSRANQRVMPPPHTHAHTHTHTHTHTESIIETCRMYVPVIIMPGDIESR